MPTFIEIAHKKCHQWNKFFEKKDVIKCLDDIENKLSSAQISPNKEDVFKAFENTNPNNIKYIILGQDPYPSTNNNIHATGRSFELAGYNDWKNKLHQNKGISCINIIKGIHRCKNNKKQPLKIDELRNEIRNNNFKISQPKKWFDETEKKGIMWLNAALTVGNTPGTHLGIWNQFINLLIGYLNSKKTNVKWIILGKEAKELAKKYNIPDDKQIQGVHPELYAFAKTFDFNQIDVDFEC